jgi:hypothetical protein
MPSRKPIPARRIGAKTSFLPSIACPRHRRLDLHLLQRQISGDLVTDQHADLVEQGTKIPRTGMAVAHQAQLVLHQRMIDDGNALHL